MVDSRAALSSARLPLLTFHQALIQAERRRREATAGPLTPVAFLQELLKAESLAWLKPMTALILSIDEQLDEASTTPETFARSLAELRELLQPGPDRAVASRVAELSTEAPELPTLLAAILEALALAGPSAAQA